VDDNGGAHAMGAVAVLSPARRPCSWAIARASPWPTGLLAAGGVSLCGTEFHRWSCSQRASGGLAEPALWQLEGWGLAQRAGGLEPAETACQLAAPALESAAPDLAIAWGPRPRAQRWPRHAGN